MSIEELALPRRRDFKRTPEPTGRGQARVAQAALRGSGSTTPARFTGISGSKWAACSLPGRCPRAPR